MGREARQYAWAHRHRAPIVVMARVERVWDLYAPRDNLNYGLLIWGRPKGWATAGLSSYLLIVSLACGGAFTLRLRRTPLWPLVSTIALVGVVSATAFGFTRY